MSQRIKGDVVKVRLPSNKGGRAVYVGTEQGGICAAAEESMQRRNISISNGSCLIRRPTGRLEGCQFVKAARAQQHLLMMQCPSVSQLPPSTGCEVVDACYMI